VTVVCSTSGDSINYDEYLDAGIPDTLLEGLGFYANSGDADAASETDEIPDEKPEPETIEEPQPQSSTTTGKFQFCIFKVLCHFCYNMLL